MNEEQAHFRFREKDFKKYPHFDKLLTAAELHRLVTDPEEVKANPFFPFLQYETRHQPFRIRPDKPDPKKRLIRYASRRDAAIFAYYRYLLAQPYEARLVEVGISDVPIAYRNIPKEGDHKGGKCNIDFAGDVFDEVLRLENCAVVALDISKFFECIDHKLLYSVWCDLIKMERLPHDHLAVFKGITRYAWVDRDAVYERLGYLGEITEPDGSVRKGFLTSFRNMPKQLCSPAEFRLKILGKDPAYNRLVQKNKETCGIPQGAPISDLLANAYLLRFDQAVANFVRTNGGRYWRYSDDIVVVVPGGAEEAERVQSFVCSEIVNHGEALRIKSEKTCMVRFSSAGSGGLNFQHISGNQGKNGLEYLGFRFDGKRVYLRDSTVANFYRKITGRARNQAQHHVRRFPGKSRQWLVEHFDFREFEHRFGRVRDFVSIKTPKGWTFWTYAKRASERFGERGDTIYRQIKGYRRYIKHSVLKEIDRQLEKSTTV